MQQPYEWVDVPETSGKMVMARMPGQDEGSVDSFLEILEAIQPAAIVCLASRDVIGEKSPAYAEALEADTLPVPVLECPLTRGGLPVDRQRFDALVRDVVDGVVAGKTYWVHAAGGTGHTGLFVGCVLKSVGVDELTVGDLLGPDEPVSDAQIEFLALYEPPPEG